MKNFVIIFLVSFFSSLIICYIFIPIFKRKKAGQPILKYVEEHKEKQGTPTMGGLFFIIPSSIICLFFGVIYDRISVTILSLGLAFLIVGFLDDYIKIKTNNNQGLKAYQKIIFQAFISIFAGIFCYINKLTICYLPFTKISIDLKIYIIPFVAFIFIALTNSVNLTDGIDGLAGSVSFIYLLILSLIIYLEYKFYGQVYLGYVNYKNILLISFSLMGGIFAFLLFNTHKAQIFMGDTGSLSLGSFLASISIFSLNSFFTPIIGIMFVFSSISVIIQVIHYKRTKKRIFLMAPFHHHLQHLGLKESKICTIYLSITLIMGLFTLFTFI